MVVAPYQVLSLSSSPSRSIPGQNISHPTSALELLKVFLWVDAEALCVQTAHSVEFYGNRV